ncbi:hypothetical protein J6590_059803 [Homalodisca vitripennis]|nr:hypothetical protein J6590_059803 [Homalodisca vitripennis]
MQAENSSLRTQVAELRKQLHDFTDELFVVNPSRNETPSTSPSVAETVQIEPGEQRSTECKNRQCTEVRHLVNSLKTTIEVLEAEIELLKSGNSSYTCTEPRLLLAGLVQSLVTAKTSVHGVCKPGAGQLGVVEGGQPPLPGSCCVLIAGANDIGAGESSTIFEHLEQQIIVAISPRPLHRPPVNKQTTLVNHYIRELCARCVGSVVLDFNTIGRRHFTRHGQHLRMGGKQVLARLVVDGLKRASLVSIGRTQPPPSLPLPSSAAPAGSPSIATAEPQSPPTLSPGSTTATPVSCVVPSPTTPCTLPQRQLRRGSKIFTSK